MRPYAVAVAQFGGVCLPAGGAQLLVDQLAGVGFAQLQVPCGRAGGGGGALHALRGLGGGLRLHGAHALIQGVAFALGLGGHLFPEGTLVFGLRGGAMLVACGFQLGAQRIQFGLQLLAFVDRRARRQEGTALECRIGEGPLEPDAEPPSQAQGEQCRAVVAGELMVGVVSGHAHFVEQRRHLTRQHAAVLQATQQVDLGLSRAGEQPGVRSGELGQQFRELAQFEQTGVGSSLKSRSTSRRRRGSCASCADRWLKLEGVGGGTVRGGGADVMAGLVNVTFMAAASATAPSPAPAAHGCR